MEVPSSKENKKEGEIPEDFGHVVDALHEKRKLSSLRTYQGDMAEFIKEKNESVVSIALKEKERKEEEQELRPLPKQDKKSSRNNLIIALVSLLLLALGGAGIFYAVEALKKEPVVEITVEEKIIPYNNLATLANVSKESLGAEIVKSVESSGISLFEISGTDGSLVQNTEDFLDFLEIELPFNLKIVTKKDYALGVLAKGGKNLPFLVILVSDYGRAFSGMLEWEESMEGDLSFLNPKAAPEPLPSAVSTTTASSTIASSASTTPSATTTSKTEVKIPLKMEIFSWQDVIVKNKDTRALANESGRAKIAYTFLDKNTVLITNDLEAIKEIHSIYSSRSIVK